MQFKTIKTIGTATGVALAFCGAAALFAKAQAPSSTKNIPATLNIPVKKLTVSNDEWRKRLTAQQYNVLRQEGTEAPYTGAYWNNHAKGQYVCAACGLPLFSSDTKFESGTGWPSYYQPLAKNAVVEKTDTTLGMVRTEVECARCGGHLGHVFDDGPQPTGLRYCMNSVSLKFVPAAPAKPAK